MDRLLLDESLSDSLSYSQPVREEDGVLDPVTVGLRELLEDAAELSSTAKNLHRMIEIQINSMK
jgi:hypothetical protein